MNENRSLWRRSAAALGAALLIGCGAPPPAPSAPASATATSAPIDPVPPEAARVVDAFAGDWTFEIAVTPPGSPAMKGEYAYACHPIALGRGVNCAGKGRLPSGPVEEVVIFAWDADSSTVRQLSVGSSGDVGDARCSWSEATVLTCAQDLTKGGAPAKEKTVFSFGSAGLAFNSTTTLANGAKIVVSGKSTTHARR